MGDMLLVDGGIMSMEVQRITDTGAPAPAALLPLVCCLIPARRPSSLLVI